MSNMNDTAVMETAVEIPANVEAQKLARKKAEKIALENNKLPKRLCRLVGQAIGDFNMI